MNPIHLLKIQKLKEICQILTQNKISFTLGGSGLLYFLGIVKKFKDWDLALYCSERELEQALFEYNLEKQVCTPPYLSTYFYRMKTDEVSFDLMGHFGVERGHERIEMSYKVSQLQEGIPLGDIKDWMTSYRLMDRPEKFEMIRDYLRHVTAD